MRCRPNDLAVVTSPPPALAELHGRIVRVVKLVPTPQGTQAWRLEKPEGFVLLKNLCDGALNRRYVGQSVYVMDASDHWLTPLRGDPAGDDAAQPVAEQVNEPAHG